MDKLQQREIVTIVGKTGYGKSTWLTRYAQRFSRIFAFDPFGKFPTQYLSSEQLALADDRGLFKQGEPFSVGSFRMDDLDFLGALSFVNGHCLLVIEECGFIWGKGERMPEWLSEIVFLGRHQNVSLAVTAQAPVYIPIDLRSQVHRLISFWITESRDIDWTESYYGERVSEVLTLPKYECLDAEDRIVTRYKLSL